MNEKETKTKTMDIDQQTANIDLSLFTSSCLNDARQLDLRKFPDEQLSNFYKDKSDVKSIIDLSGTNDQLILAIINFILYCFYYIPTVIYTSWKQINTIYITVLRMEINEIKKAGTIGDYIISKDDSFTKAQSRKFFLNRLREFELQYDDPGNWYNKPVWNLRDPHFHIAGERINQSRPVTTLVFTNIHNPVNQRYVMEYIDHLLFKSTISLSTINGLLSSIRILCQFLGEHTMTDVDGTKLDELFVWYRNGEYCNRKPNENSIARLYGAVAGLYEFLAFKNYISRNPFINYGFVPKQHWIPRENSVDEFVIEQIYAILPEIPVLHALIFLIDDCTGLRISDICRLKKNRLLSKVGDRSFLSYYNTKGKRSVPTEIPSELYDLLSVYIRTQKDSGSEYLFPSAHKKAYIASYFASEFNEFLEEYDVRTPSGEPYHYASHGLRHSQATDLSKRGASIYTIAKRLNDSLEVAIGYADYKSKDKASDMAVFSSDLEEKSVDTYAVPVEVDSDQVDYLRRTMNGLTLPHGSCKRPAVLGTCAHDPAFCLECEKFVTCNTFLNTHKQHLSRLKEALHIANSNGNSRLAAKTQRSIDALEKIINTLEEG